MNETGYSGVPQANGQLLPTSSFLKFDCDEDPVTAVLRNSRISQPRRFLACLCRGRYHRLRKNGFHPILGGAFHVERVISVQRLPARRATLLEDDLTGFRMHVRFAHNYAPWSGEPFVRFIRTRSRCFLRPGLDPSSAPPSTTALMAACCVSVIADASQSPRGSLGADGPVPRAEPNSARTPLSLCNQIRAIDELINVAHGRNRNG